jgi:outer membrane lipoprotein-sorting protein
MDLKRIGLMCVSLGALSLGAFAIDGREVMQNVYDLKKPKFSHSAVKMDLIDKGGAVESRQIEEWGKDEDGLTSMVMSFYTPASVKDTRFLQVENRDKDDDKWIYLPALRSTRRIASSDGEKSFMGTDATYDDMSTREVDQDNHELVAEKTVGAYECYVVKSVAKDAADSQYAYRLSYVDKKTWVPVQVEMFDKKGGDLLKVLKVEKLENVGGYWITMDTSMKNVKTGHSTRITIMKIEVDKALSPKLFTPAFLNTGRL